MKPDSYFLATDRWMYRKGAAFGMKGASLTIHIKVKDIPEADWSALNDLFAEIFENDIPAIEWPSPLVGPEALHHVVMWMVHTLRWAKIPVRKEYRVLSPRNKAGTVQLVVPTLKPPATIAAFREFSAALPDILRALPDRAGLETVMRKLMVEVQACTYPHRVRGQNPVFFHYIAQKMDLPIFEKDGPYLVLGTGVHAHRLSSTITGATPSLAVKLARNKHVTGELLRNAGLPGATNLLVQSLEQACTVARDLTYPVAIKPADKDGGQGVFAGIENEETLAWCYERTREVSNAILIEKHFEGVGHRITLFQGELISATRKLPAGVVGDGLRDVAALVTDEQQQRDLAEKTTDARRAPLIIDEEAMGMLRQQGLGPDDVPAKDRFVTLRRKNNASAGGSSEQLDWDIIHPANLEVCIAAADLLGLDAAGVDLLIPDITVPWHQNGALICEVNAQPQVGFEVAERIVKRLFPSGARIPLTLLVAQKPNALSLATCNAIAQQFSCNAISTANFIAADGVVVRRSFQNGFYAAQTILTDQRTKEALCVLSLDDVLRSGWPTDTFDRLLIHHDVKGSPLEQLKTDASGYCEKILHLRPTNRSPR
ncbi:MAG: hypothetical protein ACSHXH_16900 [Marivita sp.]|uniref:ATP-binding protein n=1 Tax=Marivita sp. TaxID=2003365 RepID=UPI003EFA3976